MKENKINENKSYITAIKLLICFLIFLGLEEMIQYVNGMSKTTIVDNTNDINKIKTKPDSSLENEDKTKPDSSLENENKTKEAIPAKPEPSIEDLYKELQEKKINKITKKFFVYTGIGIIIFVTVGTFYVLWKMEI